MTFYEIQAQLTALVAELEQTGNTRAAGYVRLAALKLEMAQLLHEPGEPEGETRGRVRD